MKNLLKKLGAGLLIGLAAGIGSLAGIAFATNASMDYAGNGVFYDVTVCSLFCDYDDISDAYDTEGADKSYYIRGDFTVYDLIIKNVTTDTGNTGTCVKISTSTYVTIKGIARGCDSGTNVSDNGTGTNKTGIAS